MFAMRASLDFIRPAFLWRSSSLLPLFALAAHLSPLVALVPTLVRSNVLELIRHETISPTQSSSGPDHVQYTKDGAKLGGDSHRVFPDHRSHTSRSSSSPLFWNAYTDAINAFHSSNDLLNIQPGSVVVCPLERAVPTKAHAPESITYY